MYQKHFGKMKDKWKSKTSGDCDDDDDDDEDSNDDVNILRSLSECCWLSLSLTCTDLWFA